jgi:hypothetical protein
MIHTTTKVYIKNFEGSNLFVDYDKLIPLVDYLVLARILVEKVNNKHKTRR